MKTFVMTGLEGTPTANNDLWVVTVNWNQPKLTFECIQSLRANNDLPFSLVIVDNGSTDGSVDVLRDIQPDKLIVNQTNLGFASGFNAGIKYALSQGADYVFMVNNDTISEPKMLDTLIGTAMRLDAEIASPAIFYASAPDQIWSAGGKISTLLSAPLDGHSRNKPLPTKPVQRDFFSGCALLIDKIAFEKIGFFDENFFLYYEDLDFLMRAKIKGISTWLIPEARLLHHVSGSITRTSNEAFFFWMGYSSWLYFSKHAQLWQWIFILPWRLAHAIKLSVQFIFTGRYNALSAYIRGNSAFIFKKPVHRPENTNAKQ
jgi:hypothetical protein